VKKCEIAVDEVAMKVRISSLDARCRECPLSARHDHFLRFAQSVKYG
jgi:hypothetical protein